MRRAGEARQALSGVRRAGACNRGRALARCRNLEAEER